MTCNDLRKFIAAYFVMVICFVTISVAVCLIPHSYIDNNIRQSLTTLSEEGRFPWTCGFVLWGRDNITDGSMYNVAVSGYDMNPVEEMIINPWTYQGTDKMHTADFALMTMDTRDGSIERQSYGRYWHGYQVPLRISSIFLTIKGQRIFHSVVLWSLLLLTTFLLYRRFGKYAAFGWITCFLILGFPVVPLSMQYVACYYIVFLSVTLMLLRPGLNNNNLFFFIIGGVTSYMDYMTVPLITLGVPLAVSIISQTSDKGKDMLSKILSWCLGYGGIWVTKWLIQYAYMGPDALNKVIGASEFHTIFSFLPEGINHKYFAITCGMLLLALILTLIISIFSYRKNRSMKLRELIILALIPFCWYFVLLGHNVNHIWFTYRTLTITFLCCWFMILNNKITNKKDNLQEGINATQLHN